ncbi:MAG: esterase-like activity of phytase family protein [Bdellovibrionota bacterium]
MKILTVLPFFVLACQATPTSTPNTATKIATATITQIDVTLETVDGFSFKWGGFSGLNFIKKETNGDLLFWTLTDRGPNGAEFKRDKKVHRPFLSPNFTPSFVLLKFSKAENKVSVVKTIPFKDQKDNLMTGLPPKESLAKVEQPTHMDGSNIDSDNNGVDSEALAIDSKKHFWVGDEYLPSLLEFDENGKLLARILPSANAKAALRKNEIPNAFSFRKFNRGFEALGYKNGKIFFMSQSPLGVAEAHKDKEFSVIRIGVFNTKTRIYEAEYIYPLTQKKVDKIGDLVMIDDTHFYVIEQNGDVGQESVHLIYKVDLTSATNLVKIPLARDPETYASAELLAQVKPVQKTLMVDLVQGGYSEYEKIEGLAMIDDETLAIVNDNDFGISTNSSGQLEIIERKTSLGFIAL